MIVQPPYVYDSVIYNKLPVKDRWLMNKLSLAEKLGHNCGPTGTVPSKGQYCVRPMMNIYGGGEGGFFKVDEKEAAKNLPGYFWCEWFNGPHIWTQYINDEPITYAKNVITNNILTCPKVEEDPVVLKKVAPHLPECLRGISRYMITESIGNKIIEVSPRLMYYCAYDWIVDDYKKIDPTYNFEDDDIKYGNCDIEQLPVVWRTSDGRVLKGWRWGAPINQRKS